MWKPKYTIRPKLLRVIGQIGEAIGAINSSKLPARKLSLLTKEARALSTYASTSIEGNPLPLTDVKRLLKNSPTQVRDTEREILNYNEALEWLEKQVQTGSLKPDAKTFSKIQGMVVQGLMPNPFDIGQIRKKPVVIRDPKQPESIVFIPPSHEEVPGLLESLFEFVNSNISDLDPVLLAGLFHKQSVIIHPFMDGNGRSTRLLTTAILGMTGLDIFPIFSFEAYYNRNVTKYFQVVGERGDYYDLESDFTDWLEYFAEGVLDELKRVEKTFETAKPELEPHLQEILEHLEKHGSITQREYGKLTKRSLAARKKDFGKLVSQGLVKREGAGRSVKYLLG